jgi:tetratricopeptide (TPR) repeat protein
MLNTAVKKMPRNAIAYYNLGRGYINVGNLDEARRALENAVNINPRIKEIHFNLARVFQEEGNIEQAKRHCQNALKLDSSYIKAKEYLDYLSEIRYMRPVNLAAIRQALMNFDQNDTEFMVKL